MSTKISSIDYRKQVSINDKPLFKSKCPHCGSVQQWSLEDTKLQMFGDQAAVVRTCNHEYKEDKDGHTTIVYRSGCKKQYVIRFRIDIETETFKIEEDK